MALKIYDAVEVFSGKGVLSRCLLAAGFATASIDLVDWKPWVEGRQKHGKRLCKGNPLDLATPAGFGFLGGNSNIYTSLYAYIYIYEIKHACVAKVSQTSMDINMLS